MLKKLFGMFSKVEKAESLESWLHERIKAENEKLDSSLKKYSHDLEKVFERIESQLKSLEESELRNKKIPHRALQIMEGNRESYIKNVRNFMKRTDTVIDEDFTRHVRPDLEALGQSIEKSSKVVAEFFLNETSRISEMLRQVLDIAAKVDAEHDSVKSFLDIKAQLDRESAEAKRLKAINMDIKKEKAALEKQSAKKEELENALQEIVRSDEYKEHKSLIAEKKKLEDELLEAERRINEYFSPIKPGLKKYAHMSLDEKSVNAYFEDPVKALAHDTELKIMSIVRDMCSVLDKGLIGMKDKKLEKISAAAKSFSRTDLVRLLDARNSIIDQKKKVEERIRHTQSRDYDETEYKLRHVKDRLHHIKNEIADKEKAASQVNPEAEREKAFRMVKDLGIELQII